MAWAWAGAMLGVAAAVVGGVAVANATVFSASSFARDYLDALRADRLDEVFALPGVDAAGLDDRLLTADAVEPFTFDVVSDTEQDGVHRILVSFASGATRGEATLEIERVGSRFALFPAWGFARSPVTPVTVTLTGDTRFSVNGLPVQVAEGGPATFAALTPGVYRMRHDSQFLTADALEVTATGLPVEAALEVRPSDQFTEAVQAAVTADLTACASQEVLFPVQCPFGYAIENRVVSEPRWSITEMPTAVIAASDRIGIWAVSPGAGVAHLSVQVQSLFDGTVSTLEKDVPFEAGYLIAFDGDDVVLDPRLR